MCEVALSFSELFSTNVTQATRFHPFGQYKRSVCRSICRNKSISHQQKSILNLRICRRCRIPIVHCPPAGHRSPRVGQGTDATGVCLSRADGWNECCASLYISQPFGGFRHERSHVLCVNVACVQRPARRFEGRRPTHSRRSLRYRKICL